MTRLVQNAFRVASLLGATAGAGCASDQAPITAVLSPPPAALHSTLTPAPAVDPVPAVPGPSAGAESITVPFEAGAVITPAAAAVLDGAARLYRTAGPEVMIVAGHSDTSGAGPRREMDNLILSARRADAVKQALVDRGIPASHLQVTAVGEAEPVQGIAPSRSAVVTWR